ncbi:MAG: dihydroorotase, partial [Actinomadura rubrobrunea]|nr:dihydroorotase [Actinomadura rubrobrunea]
MTATLLIKDARILGGEPADILVRDGMIVEVGRGLDAAGAQVVQADGLIAQPGRVARPTHLRGPGRE